MLGYEAILVSDATVLKTGDLSTVILENNEREALKGDRLLPLDEDEDPAFFPGAPEHEEVASSSRYSIRSGRLASIRLSF
ncbi:MAG TPA: hypothetical protein VKB53_08725 [Gammaproteobacteria bacterium]|nr:hypothetical protein [Gammaproteobacteria bacterium]HKH20950.1 hypothetical protein [Gammaproteobacteria bacterium]